MLKFFCRWYPSVESSRNGDILVIYRQNSTEEFKLTKQEEESLDEMAIYLYDRLGCCSECQVPRWEDAMPQRQNFTVTALSNPMEEKIDLPNQTDMEQYLLEGKSSLLTDLKQKLFDCFQVEHPTFVMIYEGTCIHRPSNFDPFYIYWMYSKLIYRKNLRLFQSVDSIDMVWSTNQMGEVLLNELLTYYFNIKCANLQSQLRNSEQSFYHQVQNLSAQDEKMLQTQADLQLFRQRWEREISSLAGNQVEDPLLSLIVNKNAPQQYYLRYRTDSFDLNLSVREKERQIFEEEKFFPDDSENWLEIFSLPGQRTEEELLDMIQNGTHLGIFGPILQKGLKMVLFNGKKIE